MVLSKLPVNLIKEIKVGTRVTGLCRVNHSPTFIGVGIIKKLENQYIQIYWIDTDELFSLHYTEFNATYISIKNFTKKGRIL